MLKLRPYKPCDAKVITSWLKNEYGFRQWSADRYEHYPIAPDDINAYYDRDRANPNIWQMTAFLDETPIGHLTMRYPNNSKTEIRLGFVIVDDKERNKGYGKELINLATRYASEFLHVTKISLGVFENNLPAIQCYQSCGFDKVFLEQTETYQCMGEQWNCIEMQWKS